MKNSSQKPSHLQEKDVCPTSELLTQAMLQILLQFHGIFDVHPCEVFSSSCCFGSFKNDWRTETQKEGIQASPDSPLMVDGPFSTLWNYDAIQYLSSSTAFDGNKIENAQKSSSLMVKKKEGEGEKSGNDSDRLILAIYQYVKDEELSKMKEAEQEDGSYSAAFQNALLALASQCCLVSVSTCSEEAENKNAKIRRHQGQILDVDSTSSSFLWVELMNKLRNIQQMLNSSLHQMHRIGTASFSVGSNDEISFPRDCQSDLLSTSGANAKQQRSQKKCQKKQQRRMSEKKRYEVRCFTQFLDGLIQQIIVHSHACANHQQFSSLQKEELCMVDVGAGQGFLVQELVELGYPCVIGIDHDAGSIGKSQPQELPKQKEKISSAVDGVDRIDDGDNTMTGKKRQSIHSSAPFFCFAEVGAQTNAKKLERVLLSTLQENGYEASQLPKYFVLCTLHGCGSLSSDVLQFASHWENCLLVATIGCCYNLMRSAEPFKGQATSFLNNNRAVRTTEDLKFAQPLIVKNGNATLLETDDGKQLLEACETRRESPIEEDFPRSLQVQHEIQQLLMQHRDVAPDNRKESPLFNEVGQHPLLVLNRRVRMAACQSAIRWSKQTEDIQETSTIEKTNNDAKEVEEAGVDGFMEGSHFNRAMLQLFLQQYCGIEDVDVIGRQPQPKSRSSIRKDVLLHETGKVEEKSRKQGGETSQKGKKDINRGGEKEEDELAAREFADYAINAMKRIEARIGKPLPKHHCTVEGKVLSVENKSGLSSGQEKKHNETTKDGEEMMIMKFYTKFRADNFSLYCCYWAIRGLLGSVAEQLILQDRLLLLKQNKNWVSFLAPVLQPRKSPRNTAVVGISRQFLFSSD